MPTVCSERKQVSGSCVVGGAKKDTFEGDGYVHCLDCVEGFMSVYVCVCIKYVLKFLKLYTLNITQFIVYQLSFSETVKTRQKSCVKAQCVKVEQSSSG